MHELFSIYRWSRGFVILLDYDGDVNFRPSMKLTHERLIVRGEVDG